jgi:excisionase family DNA binding protein
MTMRRSAGFSKPLLSVEEAAILLGESRSSVYRSIERGDLPLPVFTINGRLRIARRAVERLLAGELPSGPQGPSFTGGPAGNRGSERTDYESVELAARHIGTQPR